VEFPVSGFETSPLIPPLVSLVISSFTSMGGVSGAFLLLPFQMSVLGFTSPAVSATNHLYNVVAIPSGVARYVKERRMLWPLTWVVIAGTLPGVFVGAYVRVRLLPDPQGFKLFAGCVLLYVGARLIAELLSGRRARAARLKALAEPVRDQVEPQVSPISVTHAGLWRVSYAFGGETFGFPTPGVFALSLVVGVVGGTYGIGGGAIIAPFLVAFFRLPVHSVAGAALAGTFVTSVAAVISYQVIAVFDTSMPIAPDWPLGLLFGVGGMAGMYLGARCQRYVPARVIEWMLGLILVAVAARYILGAFAWRV
jgi:uncharacterized membrane protein YfcA